MRVKEILKINFSDFWGKKFIKNDNFFYNLLSKYFTIELSDNPDFLFFSCYGKEYLKYDCIRIFYSAENLRPNFNACDFAFTMDYNNDPRHFRLPLYWLYGDPYQLIQPPDHDVEQIFRQKRKFCSFVVSNSKSKRRVDFYHKLSKYKKVDSGGKLFNNVGGAVTDKLDFIKDYKFVIAFENSSFPGYTTEKIYEPMLVNSVPIYWGNPLVGREFNVKSFVNHHDFSSEAELIDYIIYLDSNDAEYKKILAEPHFPNNVLNEFLMEDKLISQFETIFSAKGKIKPVAQTHRRFIHKVEWFNRKAFYYFNKAIPTKQSFR